MIPRLIHQTWKNAEITHWIFKRSQQSIRELLPDWKYVFWSDEDLDGLMRTEFAGYYSRWLALDRPIKKVDTARYCILYRFGGIYADLDFIFTRGMDAEVLDESHDMYFYKTTQAIVKKWDFLGNAFMISEPRQQFWLDVLEYMLALPPSTPVLKHTGPLALGAFYASLVEKPRARIFDPSLFDNERCQDGVGERVYGYHVRTGTWQHPEPFK